MRKILFILYLKTLILLFTFCNNTSEIHTIKITTKDNFLTNSRQVDSLKTLSLQSIKIGNIREAKKLCEMVLKLDSLNADNLSRLSTIYFLENNFEKSLQLLNKSIRNDTTKSLTHNFTIKACIYYELNVQDSANFYFGKMLELNRDDSFDLRIIVHTFNVVGMDNKALEYNFILLKYYPNDVYANIIKASLLINQKKYNEGLLVLKKIEGNTKGNAEYYSTRGACYMYLKKLELALSDIELAHKIDSGDVRYTTGLARVLQKMGKFKDSEKYYKVSILKGDTLAVRLYNSLLTEMRK